MCTDTSGDLVSHSWQCMTGGSVGDWNSDDTISLVAVENGTKCDGITIQLSGDATNHQNDVAGDYFMADLSSNIEIDCCSCSY